MLFEKYENLMKLPVKQRYCLLVSILPEERRDLIWPRKSP